MKMENRGFIIAMAIIAGISFGMWQESYLAGAWMTQVLIALGIIKTVK